MSYPILTEDDRIALYALGFDEEWGTYLSQIPIPRKRARAAVRRLAELGLARFHRGLVTDEGLLAGSGYLPTRAGVEMGRAIDAFVWRPFCECRRGREPCWEYPSVSAMHDTESSR